MLILTFFVVLLPVGAATSDAGRVVGPDKTYFGAYVIKYTQTPNVHPRDVVEITRGGVPVCDATVLSVSGKYVLVMPKDGEPTAGDVAMLSGHLGQPDNNMARSSVPQPHYAQDGTRTRAVAGEHVGGTSGNGSSNGYYLTPSQPVDPSAGAAAAASAAPASAPQGSTPAYAAPTSAEAYAAPDAASGQSYAVQGISTTSPQAASMASNSATSLSLGTGPYYNSSMPTLGTPVMQSGYAGYSPYVSYGAMPYYGAYSPYGYSPYGYNLGFGNTPYLYQYGSYRPYGTYAPAVQTNVIIVRPAAARPAAAPRVIAPQTFSTGWKMPPSTRHH